MSNYLLKNTKFFRAIKSLYKKNKELLDIILFGSAIKGKEKPKDVDILLLFKTEVNNDIIYQMKKELDKFGIDVDIDGKTWHELFESKFLARESILSEGYSLIHKKFLFELFGYNSFSLFKYTLKEKSQSDRMRFQYALLGRNNSEGIIKRLDAIRLASTVILVPVQNEETFTEFLEVWKLNYKKSKILLPIRTIHFKEMDID